MAIDNVWKNFVGESLAILPGICAVTCCDWVGWTLRNMYHRIIWLSRLKVKMRKLEDQFISSNLLGKSYIIGNKLSDRFPKFPLGKKMLLFSKICKNIPRHKRLFWNRPLCDRESLPSYTVGAKVLISQPDGNHNHCSEHWHRIIINQHKLAVDD